MNVLQIMLYVGIALGVVLALLALDRFALWMERRGWIFYRRRRPEPGATGSTFLQMQSFMQPEIKEVIEAEQQEDAQEHGAQGELMPDLDEDGDRPGIPEVPGAGVNSRSDSQGD